MKQPINWMKESFSGVYAAFLVICFTQTAVVLLFTGNLAPVLPLGLIVGFIGVFVVNLFHTFSSRFAYSLATTSTTLAALIVLMIANIQRYTLPHEFIPTALAALMLMTIVVGLFMYLAGILEVVRLLRFMPYPVIGGFLAVTGWMLFLGSVDVMKQDLNTEVHGFWGLLSFNWLGILFGISLFLAVKLLKNKYAYIVVIVGTIVAINLFLLIAGLNHTTAIKEGYFLSQMRFSLLPDFWATHPLAQINWKIIANQFNYFLVVAGTAILIQTFRLSILEMTSVNPNIFNKEITICGRAILISGFLGALLSTPSGPVSYLLHKLKIKTIIPVVVTLATIIFIPIAAPHLLSFMPKAILVGLIIFSGLEIFYEWLYLSIWRLPLEDYLVVLAILVTAIAFGFMISITLGIVVVCIIFIIKYSRLNNIKYELTGKEVGSKHKYSIAIEQYLREKGKKTLIIKLQGYLFFGSSRNLLEHIYYIFKKNPPRTFQNLILDFQLIPEIDSSAAINFITLAKITNKYKVTLLLANCKKKIVQQFDHMASKHWLDNNVLFMPTLDYAQEWCERQFLKEEPSLLYKQDLNLLFSDHDKQRLFLSYLIKRKLPEHAIVFKEGDFSNFLCFIESGKVTATIECPGSTPIRLFTTESSVLIGEMGFFSGTPRSASIITETPCILYELTTEILSQIREDHPELITEFYQSIIHLLSARINDLNTDLKLFQL